MGMKDIEHVVVLMLENRSFDGMLGWLYERDAPALNIPPAKPGDAFRGLSSIDPTKFINHANDGLASPPVRGTWGFTVPSVDPGEEFEHVNMQFFGTETPPPGAVATMTGVLQDFVNVMKSQGYDDATIRATAPMIMQTYTQRQLPVLNQLARHYAVSDDWFASVPSQTNPNRAFLMTGTSHGEVNNGQLETDPRAKELEKILGMGIGDDRFPDNTIFNALAAANTDWAVFWQTSYLPHKISRLLHDAPYLGALLALLSPLLAAALLGTLEALKPYTDYIDGLASDQLSSDYTWRLFPAIQKLPNASQQFKKLDQFHALARAGQLPKFSYIEPYWTIAQSSTNAGIKNLFTQMGNDYHPPGNMIVAENFVKDVYASLIANPAAWNKTLLVITFDEFVGSFDHVAPPKAVPPWGSDTPPFSTNGFAFDRFGARIPSILVSPWIEKGTVFRSNNEVPFDHTSVIATTLKWLGREDLIPGFGERTKHAPMFHDVLTLNQPRTDAADIGFLEVKRNTGDPVRFGDLILLKNQNGKYVAAASRTLKVVGSLPSDDLMGFAVDLNLAAYFPTLGDSAKATLSFETALADAPSQVPDGTRLFLVTQEGSVGAANFLGAWSDSHDCYYYNNYIQGGYVENETWIVKQVDRHGEPLCFGDKIYLENVHFANQRLTHDSRPFQGGWITTATGGDYWTIEPAVSGGMQFAGELAACSWGQNRIDTFGLDSAGSVLQMYWDGAWHWANLGNRFAGTQFAGELTACSWGENRIDTFGLDAAGNVLQLAWDGAWHWNNLGSHFAGGARFAGELAACSWGKNRIDVFGLDTAGHMLHLYWDGAWHWENLGNGFAGGARLAGQLTACSWGKNRIDVFGLDAGGNVLQLWWDGAWHWNNLGSHFSGTKFAGQLAASSWGENRIDMFGVDAGGNVLQLAWDGSWHWDNLGNHFSGTKFAGQLTACSWGKNRIDVFGLAAGGSVLQLWWNGAWHWNRLS
jgi:phospholipase C